jgi:cyclic pyranopterin phosphate synthase
MVDVTGKDPSVRLAVAEGRILMEADTLQRIRSGTSPKGDPLRVAQIAGIMAGKKTGELIPLCHQLQATSFELVLEADETLPGIVARAEARITGQTGVEMEALTAVSVALLTVYDMVKAVDRGMRIEGIHLLRKEGGRSGAWTSGQETG